MPAGEIYIQLIVGFPNDPKVRALARFGDDAGLARDLYVQMALYCRDVKSDGFVPDEQIGLLVYPLDPEHGKQLAKQLASVRLINEEAGGWLVLAYLKRNPSREAIKELSGKRAVAGAKGGRARPGSADSADQTPGEAKRKQVASDVARQNGTRVRVREREVQTPTESAGGAAAGPDTEAEPLTVTQRSKRITDAYAEAEPMCKWPAVNGVVIKAIQTEKWTDAEIRDALLRMAKENRSVTIDALRIELAGLSPQKGRAAGAPRSANHSPERYGVGFRRPNS